MTISSHPDSGPRPRFSLSFLRILPPYGGIRNNPNFQLSKAATSPKNPLFPTLTLISSKENPQLKKLQTTHKNPSEVSSFGAVQKLCLNMMPKYNISIFVTSIRSLAVSPLVRGWAGCGTAPAPHERSTCLSAHHTSPDLFKRTEAGERRGKGRVQRERQNLTVFTSP